MQPLLMVSLMSVLLMLPPLGMGQTAPREKDRDRQERIDRDRDGFAFSGRDRAKDGEDRAYEERESAGDVRNDRAEVERELRQAAAERDRQTGRLQLGLEPLLESNDLIEFAEAA